MFKHLKDDGIGPAISTEEFWDVIMEAQQEGAKQEREQEPGLPRRPEDWAPPSPEEAAMSLRMGSWRLKGRVHPQLEALVAQVEAAWRGSFHGDFKLFLTPLRLKFRDSVDPDQENPASYGDIIDPAADGPGFPRFMLESRAYRTRVFRKCLLHLTHRQDDSQTLLCAMYPRVNFDLPVLMLQVTADASGITSALIDACPVNAMRQLPPYYAAPVRDTQERFRVPQIDKGPLPAWAQAVCSPLAVCLEPSTAAQKADTIKYAVALVRYHTEVGRILDPITANAAAARRQKAVQKAHEALRAACLAGNTEVRQPVARAFGPGWADELAKEVLFDCHTANGDVNLDDV